MAAFFVDLDGTFFKFGTNVPLRGAVRAVSIILRKGHQVVFTTARSRIADARLILDSYGFDSCLLLGNIQSPRVVINDDGAFAVNHETDAPWTNREELSFLPIMDLQDEAFAG